MQKKLTVAAAAAALAIGGAAAIAVPALADSTPTPSPSASGAPSPSTTPGTPGQRPGAPEQNTQDRTDRIKAQLKSLVDDGTVTQAQADKVAAKLAEAGPQQGFRQHFRGGPGGRGGPMGFGPELQKAQTTAAKAIGISEEQLRQGLGSGKTLAALAKEHGKSTDDVVNPLVAEAKQSIAQAVTDKKLTQEQADRFSQNLEERIRGFVENGRMNVRMHGPGGRGQDQRTEPGDGQTPPAPPSLPSPEGAAPSSTT